MTPNLPQVPLVNAWLARSANSPLYLKFDYRHEEPDLRAASQILTSFISRLEYWRTIDFKIPLQLLGAFFSIVQFSKIPVLLESCVLEFNDSLRYPYDKIFGPYIEAIHTSPNLRRVTWARPRIDNPPRHAPFHQLTHVDMDFSLSIDEALAFLATVPLIEELSISIGTFSSTMALAPGAPLLLLQHLRFLIICSRSIPDCSSFFSSITCPSLQRLRSLQHFKFDHDSQTDQPNQSLSELIQLLQRSNCQLQYLDISDPHLSDNDLALLLQSPTLCSLVHLSVKKDVVSDQIIHLLMKRTKNGSHRVLFRLEILALDFCNTTDGLLARMISSRWHGTAPSPGTLRHALVTPFGPIDIHFFNANILY
jgi:hypothetical protein